MMPVTSPAPNFDRLAPHYQWMERLCFGPWLWRCRCAFLGEMQGARSALVLGDGDGRFTAHLMRRNLQVTVESVDVSHEMVHRLNQRVGFDQQSRMRSLIIDVRTWPRLETDQGYWNLRTYDLVVSHFVLDCLTTDEVEGLAARIRPHLTAEALWVVSEFAIPRGWYGRLVAGPIVAMLYWAFGWLTGLRVRELPDYDAALERAGFQLVRRRKWLGGLLVSECWGGSASGGESSAGTNAPGNPR